MKLLYIDKELEQNSESLELISFYLGTIETFQDNALGLEKYILEFNNTRFYDLIFLSYYSIILDGEYLFEKILEINPNQKIILLTDTTNLHFMKTFLFKGVENFLLTPIDENQLKEVLQINVLNESNSSLSSLSEINISNKKSFYKNYYEDTLTKLPNRNKLEIDLHCDTLPVLMLIDIDKLSVINEIYGIEVGNKVIEALSIFLRDFAKKEEYSLYKVSCGSFVLANCVEVLDIIKYQNSFTMLFNHVKEFKISHNNQYISIDITAGISMVQSQPFEKATIALNYAKKMKKDYIVYSNMLNDTEQKLKELQWKDKLRDSITLNNIVSVYQAIVDKDENILKYEALMRIRDTDGKLISPFYFLDIAVDTKQYIALSTTLIKKALNDALYCTKDISINVTYTDILNYHFIDEVAEFIVVNKIGKKLIFEIVENEYIEDYELLDNFISKFRKIGVRIAIDDFGSGFSNFEYILKLRPDYIKIDGSLIRQIKENKDFFVLVESIIKLAHKLGIKIICEYVATKDIFTILKRLNVDEYQGYYFHKPKEINF